MLVVMLYRDLLEYQSFVGEEVKSTLLHLFMLFAINMLTVLWLEEGEELL